MTERAYKELRGLINRFVSGADRSKVHVADIEGLLIEEFAETELFDKLSPCLAAYQPGGGKYYYDEEQLAAEFRYVLSNFLSGEYPHD